MAKNGKKPAAKSVEMMKHDEAKRKNIPTAEYQSVLENDQQNPKQVFYPRNRDLDPQLVWRGKDEQDWSDLVVQAPPLYIQEKVHPKALVDDLLRTTRERDHESGEITADLFADFNGVPKGTDKTEFYQHDQNWSNRMILGDSLQVMASLAEREGLRGKVQCIYFDPPYGIKFNSNFQWSTTDRSPKAENAGSITREPEQVKAFRDTWRDGIHSYLTYLRDRLTVARDLLTDSGSIFVQIGDENVHRVRALMDEVFGPDNLLAQIAVAKTAGLGTIGLSSKLDYLLYYAKDSSGPRYNQLFSIKNPFEAGGAQTWVEDSSGMRRRANEEDGGNPLLSPFVCDNLSAMFTTPHLALNFQFRDQIYSPGRNRQWQTTADGLVTLAQADRLIVTGSTLRYVRFHRDFVAKPMNNLWEDTGTGSFTDPKIYVVQTARKIVERCILMTTNPGDLVLDPTCGSGTTAYVAEQWGRRWITIDTSRVALALARSRIMGARYPFYLIADSRDGQVKEGEITRSAPSTRPVRNDIRLGFVYERVPHIKLKSIASNKEIGVICEKWQAKLDLLREKLNVALKTKWNEWEVPREAEKSWPEAGSKLHAEWWDARIARQKEIDASISAKAEFEYLYDKPYQDSRKVRVAGPFTVESLSPHRILGVDEDDELVDGLEDTGGEYGVKKPFPEMILENLKIAGVQQAHKEDRINFTSLTPWPGDLVCAEGRYMEGDNERRAAIFIGPEFGTVLRADLVAAAREAGDAAFDVLITCAFNYEAHTTEFNKLGRIPVLKARMNADLHMAADLKNTGKGNLFVIFGEPDIDLIHEKDDKLRVKVNGVDVFKPQTGEVISDNADGIACWFIDTDYNEESFFVRHAYFLGANDPYGALKTTLKAEIDLEAWATLNSDTSRPFDKPKSGRIAVKVINHLGDEVMKVFRVQ
ncbi:site-specific DNA-methyltransferase [Bradyrhizobium sp. 131]|uniref:site-specific DNA-methyltransferase n=1 Tax=Bradyrhizobium sp. 131 TaxID=2782609 RepID=UPI001FFFC249|nr:site-specific DNA-methyltransferase [Bradyrhizobium sp. 131]UPK17588.1 site-specific DNA-methyltransferase [Bradyrhizobium sp. 131]